MNLQQFYQNTVCVTMKDLGDERLNKTHMITGMTSEILDELTVAIAKSDYTNYREEIGDTEWFALGAMKFYGLTIPEETPDAKDFVLNYLDEVYNHSIKTSYLDFSNDPALVATMYINHVLGVFNAILKKEITSGVKKYEGQEVTNLFLQDRYDGLLWSLMVLSCCVCGNSNENTLIFPAPIRGIRKSIHEKLVLRHSGKAMTTESDLGRDTKAERNILANGNILEK